MHGDGTHLPEDTAAGAIPILVAAALPLAPALAPSASAVTNDWHYSTVSGVPFAEISPNETGESPHLLNVTAWGMRADGELEDIERSTDVRSDTFAVFLRWSQTNDRHLECWGGQRNTSRLNWTEVSGSSYDNLPTGCLVAPDDLHRANGTTIWAVDAEFHFRLNPKNGTEVFDHYERAQLAIFSPISLDATEEKPCQIHQFTIRPADWNHWLEEANLSGTATTQSAEKHSAERPGLGMAATVGLIGVAAVVAIFGLIKSQRE